MRIDDHLDSGPAEIDQPDDGVTRVTPSPAGEKAKSWRDVLPVHPATDLFPLMSPDELRALGEDIKKNGRLTSSIAVTPDGRLLDGRNRLDAMEAVGIECEFHLSRECRHINLKADGKRTGSYHVTIIDDDPYAYVVSANIHRRHLTAEQKRGLIAKLLKATPEKSNRQIAETVKVDHKTVAAVRAKREARGEIPHVETRADTRGRQQPARRAQRRSPAAGAHCPGRRNARKGEALTGNDVDPQASADSKAEMAQAEAVIDASDSEVEERWRVTVGICAMEATRLANVCAQEFGDAWTDFTAPPGLVATAWQAADIWARLAATLGPRPDGVDKVAAAATDAPVGSEADGTTVDFIERRKLANEDDDDSIASDPFAIPDFLRRTVS